MVQLWTDGSHTGKGENTKCGVGILIRRLNPSPYHGQLTLEHKFAVGMQNVRDNNLAELYAIQYGLFKLSQLKLHPQDKKLVIITDSQVAINLLNGGLTRRDDYREVAKDILFRLRRYDYKVYWKKGHADCERQCLCDRLAKQGRNL